MKYRRFSEVTLHQPCLPSKSMNSIKHDGVPVTKENYIALVIKGDVECLHMRNFKFLWGLNSITIIV